MTNDGHMNEQCGVEDGSELIVFNFRILLVYVLLLTD